jgi:hypothetical protein
MAKKKIIKPEENLNEGERQNTLKVEIVSNWSLLKILSDRRKVLKIIISLLVIVFTIFIGLAFVAISIKRIYPYNDIKVNAFGATIMQNEDVEIIYWLFNTAELWANSGIRVEKGDRLTIRASGKFHTAIHHLVEDVSDNKKLRDKWVGTDGENKVDMRDMLRGKYRIFKNEQQDALLMQVIPEKNCNNDKKLADEFLVISKENEENFYFIGKERNDLRVLEAGILHFAVNDIVLTKDIIEQMIKENNDSICKKLNLKTDSFITEELWKKGNKDCYLKFGAYPGDSVAKKERNEMTYYRDEKYPNAWYDDNVGSFLIVIERRKNK